MLSGLTNISVGSVAAVSFESAAIVNCRKPIMSKLSIKAKVIAVIAFMLVTMSGMGLLAIRSMQGINAHTVEIATSWLPSVRVLGELRADINLFRIALRAHVMAETLEAKAANDKRLAGILERIAKDRKAYEPLITSAEERSIFENWVRAWDKYMTGVQEVVELSRQSIGRIPHEASEAISKKVAVIAAESDTFLEKAIDLNNTGADTATRLAAEGYNSAFWIVLGVVLAVIVCGIGVGVYLVRDLSSGIAAIVKPMQALGSGDLTAEVTRRGENTEIGAMADALQVFKDALIAKKAADADGARDAEAKIERGRRVDNITRELRGGDRRDRRNGVVGLDRTRGVRRHADLDGGARAGIGHHRRLGLRGGLHQRAVGGIGDRGNVVLGHRDQPAGAGIRADGERGGRAGLEDQRPGRRVVEGRGPHRRRVELINTHRGPDQPAGAERDHRGGARR